MCVGGLSFHKESGVTHLEVNKGKKVRTSGENIIIWKGEEGRGEQLYVAWWEMRQRAGVVRSKQQDEVGDKLQNVWLLGGELSRLKYSGHQMCTVGQRGKHDSSKRSWYLEVFFCWQDTLVLTLNTAQYWRIHACIHKLFGTRTSWVCAQTTDGTWCADLLFWGSSRFIKILDIKRVVCRIVSPVAQKQPCIEICIEIALKWCWTLVEPWAASWSWPKFTYWISSSLIYHCNLVPSACLHAKCVFFLNHFIKRVNGE